MNEKLPARCLALTRSLPAVGSLVLDPRPSLAAQQGPCEGQRRVAAAEDKLVVTRHHIGRLYEAGHMIYIHKTVLVALKNDVAQFIRAAVPR